MQKVVARRFPKLASSFVLCLLALCAYSAPDLVVPLEPPHEAASASGFTKLAARGLDVDFTPTKTPADAISRSELIVRGQVAAIVEGEQLVLQSPVEFEDTEAQKNFRFYTLVVHVDKVIYGNKQLVADNQVHLRMRVAPDVDFKELQEAAPGLDVVAVVKEATATPLGEGSSMTRPEVIPASASILSPFYDGLWFQGPQEEKMLTMQTSCGELDEESWQGVCTLNNYESKLNEAI